jgi:acyl-CoA thioesterase I
MYLASSTHPFSRYGAHRLVGNIALAAVCLIVWASAAMAEVRVLAFGDSLVQGYGLPAEDGFVPQLQAWLHSRGAADVEVINGGVSGDTSAGGLGRIDWALSDNVDAVIVELGANDMLRGLPLDALRDNLDGVLQAVESAGLPALLVGVSVPANYGSAYRSEFRAVYQDLAADSGAILYPDFFAGMQAGRTMETAVRLMQDDGIHPNAEGVRANVEAIGPVVLQLVERARD